MLQAIVSSQMEAKMKHSNPILTLLTITLMLMTGLCNIATAGQQLNTAPGTASTLFFGGLRHTAVNNAGFSIDTITGNLVMTYQDGEDYLGVRVDLVPSSAMATTFQNSTFPVGSDFTWTLNGSTAEAPVILGELSLKNNPNKSILNFASGFNFNTFLQVFNDGEFIGQARVARNGSVGTINPFFDILAPLRAKTELKPNQVSFQLLLTNTIEIQTNQGGFVGDELHIIVNGNFPGYTATDDLWQFKKNDPENNTIEIEKVEIKIDDLWHNATGGQLRSQSANGPLSFEPLLPTENGFLKTSLICDTLCSLPIKADYSKGLIIPEIDDEVLLEWDGSIEGGPETMIVEAQFALTDSNHIICFTYPDFIYGDLVNLEFLINNHTILQTTIANGSCLDSPWPILQLNSAVAMENENNKLAVLTELKFQGISRPVTLVATPENSVQDELYTLRHESTQSISVNFLQAGE